MTPSHPALRPLRPTLAALATLLLVSPVPGGSNAAGGPGEVLHTAKISKLGGGAPRQLRAGDQFGRGSDVLGDLDGDGVPELVVGAPKDDDGESRADRDYGAVHILFLHADGTVRHHTKIARSTGGWSGDLAVGDEFGRTVAGIGDFDLDGIPDLAVGAAHEDDGGSDQGAVWILLLRADGTVKAEQKISALAGGFTEDLDPGDQFGRALLGLGDLDRDGVDDLLVGAAHDDDGSRNAGAVYVLFLRADATVRASQKISATRGGLSEPLSKNGEFGFDASRLGDLDGDGVLDIAVSSPDQKTNGQQEGAVFVLHLRTDGTVKSDFRITEGHAGFTGHLDYNDEFGACIGTIGDVDGDGVTDLAVGAGKDDDGMGRTPSDRGAVWILFLNWNGTVRGHQKISELEGGFTGVLQDGDRFGTSLAAPGDWNGDGVPDIFVGARFDDDGGRDCGAMYLLRLGDGVVSGLEARFSASPRAGEPPLTVQFTDESIGAANAWDWDFGDGGSSSEATPSHRYSAEGTYTVSLTVGDATGSTDHLAQTDFVVVSDADPHITRYGCGVNPPGSLDVLSGTPKLDTVMEFGLDNPLGTQAAGAAAVLLLSFDPDPAYPCGSPVPGNGMGGGDAERLIRVVPPNPVRRISGIPFGGPGFPGRVTLAVPPHPGLAGRRIYCQGFLFDPTAAQGVRMGLTDALELTLY